MKSIFTLGTDGSESSVNCIVAVGDVILALNEMGHEKEYSGQMPGTNGTYTSILRPIFQR